MSNVYSNGDVASLKHKNAGPIRNRLVYFYSLGYLHVCQVP